MSNAARVPILLNVAYGLLFYVIIGAALGFGLFITLISAADVEAAFAAFLGLILFMYLSPIIALVIGVLQGKIAWSGAESLIAGGMTGVVGFIPYIIILIFFFGLGFAAKFPTEVEEGYEQPKDLADREDIADESGFGRLLLQFIAVIMPNGLLGAMAGFMSFKYFFPLETSTKPPAPPSS